MKIRIDIDGTVRGLWDDAIDWQELGRCRVRRASHVEFDNDRQRWTVQNGRTNRNALRTWWRRLLGRADRDVLFVAATRDEAIRRERRYFEPGGPGDRGARSSRIAT